MTALVPLREPAARRASALLLSPSSPVLGPLPLTLCSLQLLSCAFSSRLSSFLLQFSPLVSVSAFIASSLLSSQKVNTNYYIWGKKRLFGAVVPRLVH